MSVNVETWKTLKNVRNSFLEKNSDIKFECSKSDGFFPNQTLKELTDMLFDTKKNNKEPITGEILQTGAEMFIYLSYCPNIVENNVKVKYLNDLFNEIIAGPFTKSQMIVMKVNKHGTPYQNETFQLLQKIQKYFPLLGFETNSSSSSSKLEIEDKQILELLRNDSSKEGDNS